MGEVLGGLGPTVVTVMWTESALAILFTSARYVSRTITVNRLGWDDIFIGLTMVSATLYAGRALVLKRTH